MNQQRPLLEPWIAVGQYADNLVDELKAEVNDQHPLWSIHVRPIAQRTDCDDVLFSLEGGRVAVVHLTWSGARECNVTFPEVTFFDSLDEWATNQMFRDHDEFLKGRP
jgi:hypothetical protein